MGTKIKVHDVLHEQSNYNPSDVEDYIMRFTTYDVVSDVRIAPGDTNSPIFITLESDSVLSNQTIKRIARSIVSGFSHKVDGVDVEKTVRDLNIMVQTT